MAESFVERRKMELGITGNSSDSTSFVERRKAELGMVNGKKGTLESNADRADVNLSPIQSANMRNAPQLQANADRADVNLSPVESSKFRTATEAQTSLKRRLSNEDKTALSAPLKAGVKPTTDYASEPPIIRDIHRGLDAFSNSNPVKLIGDLGMQFYTPGAPASVVGAAEQGAANLIGRLAPGLGKSLGGKIAKTVATQSAVGAPLGVGNELAKNPEATPKELLTAGAYGAGGGAALGTLGRLGEAGLQKGAKVVGDALRGVQGAQMGAIDSAVRSGLPSKPLRPVNPLKKEPTNLNDLVKSKGFSQTTPETIAQTYNGKTWYHGTGTDKLTANKLDPFVGNHESLFGQGVYLTDNPKIAEGYANSRGRRSGTPTTYQSNVNVNRVLDLEKPVTPDVAAAIDKTVKPLDYQYEQHIGEPNYFTNLMREEMSKPGSSPESVITALRKEVRDFSHEAQIPTSEFVENFQDLAINLKQAGYDGITHTGGLRTGKDPHRVLILLDPQNWHGGVEGQPQVTSFNKFTPGPEQAGPLLRVKDVRGVGNTANPNIAAVADQVNAQTMKGNWFTNLFGEQGVGITPAGSAKQISKTPLTSQGAIVKNSIRDDKNGIGDAVAAQYRAQYQNHVDMLDPLRNAGPGVYDTAMDASRAPQLANNIVGKDFVTPEGVRIGDGMESIFGKVPRGLDKKFMDYLIKRDAEARIPRGERVYHEDIKVPNPDNPQELIPLNSETAVRAQREALEKQHPWMVGLGKEWDQFTKNLREVYGVDEGTLSRAASDAMEQSRPNYIKMNREFSKSEKPGRKYLGRTSGQTFSGLKAPIQKVNPNGSARNIVDPRKTMAEFVGAMVNNAMRNRVMKKLYENISADPKAMEGIARIVPETAEATKRSVDEVNHIIETQGMDGLVEKFNHDFEMAFKKSGQDGGKDNIVTAMIDGHPVKIEVMHPEIATAIQGMNPTQAGIVTEVAQKMSNAVKRSATGPLAPLFAAKSVTMDLSQALMQSDNPARFIPDYIHAVFSSVADRLKIPGIRNMARDFRMAGGGYSAALRGERGLNKTVKNLDRLPLLSPRNIGRQALKWNPISTSFKAGESISDIFENAPRMAAAKGKLRQLGGERTPENVRQAMNASREITVNYSRKGRLSKDIEAFFPYSNAAMQSLYRVTRQFKKKPLQTAAALTVLSVLPKMFEYAHFHEDPDYQNLPARERFRNIIISKNADGTFNKIPMDQTYNAIGEMTIETLRHFKDKDPNAFKGSMDALSNALLPPIASGALQGATQGGGIEQSGWGLLNTSVGGPVIGALANQSYTGAPIEPMKVQDRSPQYRYDEKTSGVAKWLGQKLGYSPMKVDYIIRQYGGDASRLLLPLTSQVGAGTPKNTLLRNFIVDPVFTNNLTNDYYQGKQLLSQANRDNKEVGANLPKWYSEELDKYINSTAKGSISKQLSALSDEKKTVQTDRSYTAEQKAQKLRDVQRRMNEIYIDVNSRMGAAGVPLIKR